MKRLAIITVGKTHSGKTTFAKELEQQLKNSVVIDQDHHAEFINTHYKSLRPEQGPNIIKYAITNTIVDYAVQMTNYHLILSNSNLNLKNRSELLVYFHSKSFRSVLVHFDLPNPILEERVRNSCRSKSIFRTASNFKEVLSRQDAEYDLGHNIDPREGEADDLFIIKDSAEVKSVIQSIVNLSR
ncbi:CRISPR-associated protein Cas2 [Paenibacillus sp. CAA11]|uniref:ATP-binding protein n=1 Tax=Paenibacillus sp. CAA11 TaxID=1532905 RepID=UPI000D396629|nr:ATP-binding protein [Paenibacillus sp. CAA11]AWB45246.1 CRISPR-associated protein Cas2 [Paenibacillus sp. CAA11]